MATGMAGSLFLHLLLLLVVGLGLVGAEDGGKLRCAFKVCQIVVKVFILALSTQRA